MRAGRSGSPLWGGGCESGRRGRRCRRMSSALRARTGDVFVHRAHHETAEFLVPPVADHVPWADVSEQWVHGLKPKRRLGDVAFEELRNEAADVRDFFEAIEHFFRNLLIEPHRRRRDPSEFGDIPLLQVKKLDDLTGVQRLVCPEAEVVLLGDSCKKQRGFIHATKSDWPSIDPGYRQEPRFDRSSTTVSSPFHSAIARQECFPGEMGPLMGPPAIHGLLFLLVGAPRFELGTPCTPCNLALQRRATHHNAGWHYKPAFTAFPQHYATEVRCTRMYPVA